jgi:tetratricopeptide (TPR) repeat protein
MSQSPAVSERAREFAAIAARMERERIAAGDSVAQHLHKTPMAGWQRLAELPSLHTNAALEQLSEEVRKRIDRDNIAALSIATLATAIADALPAGSYPAIMLAQIRATAWRDRANASRYLARHEDALRAIQRAESILEPFAAVAFDRAATQLVKAMILAQTERFEEAEAMIAECRTVFLDSGDEKQYRSALLVQANMMYCAARYNEAQEIYTDLLQAAAASRDFESQARLHNNLGFCLTHLGDYVTAKRHFSDAVAAFTDLGYKAEVPRTQRGAGLVLIARGQTNTGLAQLRDARDAFTRFAMIEEAGLCGLNIAEILLDRGERAEARLLIDTVARELASAGVDPRAIGAIATLQEAMHEDGATAETVRTVHSYVETLRLDRPCPVTA